MPVERSKGVDDGVFGWAGSLESPVDSAGSALGVVIVASELAVVPEIGTEGGRPLDVDAGVHDGAVLTD